MDVWLIQPTVDAKSWWHAGIPNMPEDYLVEKTVKATKFGAMQSAYVLPKVIQTPQDISNYQERTWQAAAAPTKWEELEDREYLNRTVWPILQCGLKLLEKERPNRPVRALAEFLLVHNKDVSL